MDYRVEELANAADVSVDTIRFYQSKGLIPAPQRRGRVVYYSTDHLARLRRIRKLQSQGLTLALIARLLEGRLKKPEADLARAVAQEGAEEQELLTLGELADRSGIPEALLKSLEREGLLLGQVVDGEEAFTPDDVEIVKAGLAILDAGLPMSELMELAKQYHSAASVFAERAVEMFDEHVRRPIKDKAASEDEAAERLVAAFRVLLPSVTSLISDHFRRTLLRSAQAHLEKVGDSKEIELARAEGARGLGIDL